jgi:2-C-methyl-D-erythritol 4-phosphate cytidylyltransferase
LRGVVLLLAAGVGARLGSSGPKALTELDGSPIVCRAFEAIESAELVDGVVVAVPSGHERRFASLLPPRATIVEVVTGGSSRQASARAALDAAPAAEAYLVHDAARPLAPPSLFDACLRELDRCEAVCPAMPLADTIKETEGDHVTRTLDRSKLVAAQTPQGFRADVYRRAHERAAGDGFDGTDDTVLVERIGVEVCIIPGDDRNMKITTAHDVAVAEALLRVPR